MKSCSVVIITYNEEKNITRCLESVKDIADEIVVVDSLSTDNTKSICAGYNVRFIEQTFLGYIEQKNFALNLAKYDYVLSLDADEAIDETLKTSILAEKENNFPYDGYSMNRCNYFCGKWIKHGTWYPDRKLRLINSKKARWGGENPHDKIEMNPNSKTQKLNGDILHYTYYSLEELIAQMNRFSSIQAAAMFKKGKKANYFKMIFNPAFAFISGYIFKRGFLEGYEGYIIARSVSFYTLLKYSKLIQLHRFKKHRPN